VLPSGDLNQRVGPHREGERRVVRNGRMDWQPIAHGDWRRSCALTTHDDALRR